MRVALDEGETILVAVTAPPLEPFEVNIVGTPVVADETCIDVDLGEATGPALASGNEDEVLLWTAPATATYVLSAAGATALDIFVPGCGELGPTLATGWSWAGAFQGGSAWHSLELVEGQVVALAISANVDGPEFELSITQNTTVAGTCCPPHVFPGCDEPSIEAAICEVDGYCCGDHWDINCSNAARYAFDANCIVD